jgi:hypothetical protein
MKLLKRLLFAALLAPLFFAAPGIEPARATIFYVGGEDESVTFSGTCFVDTTAGHFRSGYAREGLVCNYSSTASDPPANRIIVPNFGSQSTIWFHAEADNYTTGNSISNTQIIGIYGSDGFRRLILRGTGTTGQVKISTRNGAGSFVDLVVCTSGAWPTAALAKLDWFVNYAVAGHTTLYANGVQICDYSGDITTNSITAVNQIDLNSPCSAINCPGSNDTAWSELIVSDLDTRSMNLVTLAPVAAGANQGWGGIVSSINENAINDTNNISTSTNNVVSEWTIGGLPAGSFSVPAVCTNVRYQIGASGPAHFAYIARPGSGSTDNASSSVAPTTTFANYLQATNGGCWTANPNSGAFWTTTDLGSGTNFGIKSLP